MAWPACFSLHISTQENWKEDLFLNIYIQKSWEDEEEEKEENNNNNNNTHGFKLQQNCRPRKEEHGDKAQKQEPRKVREEEREQTNRICQKEAFNFSIFI